MKTHSGVVSRILHNSSEFEYMPSYKENIGGRFLFEEDGDRDIDEFWHMKDIFAVSFEPIEDIQNYSCLTRNQHFRRTSNADFGKDSPAHYYRILFSVFNKETI